MCWFTRVAKSICLGFANPIGYMSASYVSRFKWSEFSNNIFLSCSLLFFFSYCFSLHYVLLLQSRLANYFLWILHHLYQFFYYMLFFLSSIVILFCCILCVLYLTLSIISNIEFENCQVTKIAGKKSAYVTQRNENGLAREKEPLFFWELLILQIDGSIQCSRITPIKANRVEKDRRKYGGNRFTPWGASNLELTSSLDFCRKCHCFTKIALFHFPQIFIIVYVCNVYLFNILDFFIALYNPWKFYFTLNSLLL